MRALVQRVSSASVTLGDSGEVLGRIGSGLVVLVGVTHDDGPDQAFKLADKVWNLRVLADVEGAMNLSLAQLHAVPRTDPSGPGDVQGVLVVSQFTLYGATDRGRRPSFADAARPEVAEPLVDVFVSSLRGLGAEVCTGRFGARMEVMLVNDGPVTLMLDV